MIIRLEKTKLKTKSCTIYIFISRGNILNNKVNMPYGPQTIKKCNKTHNTLLTVKSTHLSCSEKSSGTQVLHKRVELMITSNLDWYNKSSHIC